MYTIEQPFSFKGKCTQNESGLIVIMKVFYISSILRHAWREVHSNWKGVKSHYFDVLNRSTRWHLQQITLTGSARCGLVSWFLNVTSPLAYLFRTSKYWDFTPFHFGCTSPLMTFIFEYFYIQKCKCQYINRKCQKILKYLDWYVHMSV